MDQSKYLEQYPEAIQDKDRAHEMALAGNAQRTKAALCRLEVDLIKQIDGGDVTINRLEDSIYRTELGYVTQALLRGDIDEAQADRAVHEIIDCQVSDDKRRAKALPLAIQAIRNVKSIYFSEDSMATVISRKHRSAKRYDARAEAKERVL